VSFAYVSDDGTRSVVIALNRAGGAPLLQRTLDAVFC
jgi:hypothetical protein